MNARRLVQGGIIAALYAALTLAVAPISSGLFQCRISEALCVLPYFTPTAAPGLFIGCLTANLLIGAPLPDVAFGSLATLFAALCAGGIRRRNLSKWLIPLPAVVINALVVGWLLTSVYGLPVSYYAACLYVLAGQAVSCYLLGMPLMLALERVGRRGL